MSRSIRTTVAAITAVAALAAAGTASAAPQVGQDPVGPAPTIDLKIDAKKAPKPRPRIFRITNVRANANGLGWR
jgi:hypothetical protein